MIQPETQFATVGNDRVAYQVIDEAPRDLVYTTGFWSHLDIEWEDPGMARFFRRLASFSRLIRFDRRGTGLSDRPSDAGSSEVERWLQDCAAVLDAVGSTAATIVGMVAADIGALTVQFVDRHPHRCSGLVLHNTTLHRGRFIESSGDGTLATFESPGRAIDCALALHEATRPLGISLRAGLHTGEVELRHDGRVGAWRCISAPG